MAPFSPIAIRERSLSDARMTLSLLTGCCLPPFPARQGQAKSGVKGKKPNKPDARTKTPASLSWRFLHKASHEEFLEKTEYHILKSAPLRIRLIQKNVMTAIHTIMGPPTFINFRIKRRMEAFPLGERGGLIAFRKTPYRFHSEERRRFCRSSSREKYWPYFISWF